MTPLSAEQELALAYGPASLRMAFRTLLQLDQMLGNAVHGAREPLLVQIRLAWWKEQIEALPNDIFKPDPLLAAVDAILRTHDVRHDQIVALVNGWETLLDDSPFIDDQFQAYAEGRGAGLFRFAAEIAGLPYSEGLGRAGRVWSLADLANRHADVAVAERAAALARAEGAAPRLSRPLRTFGILARFAERDLQRKTKPGSPKRIIQIWTYLSGMG